MSDKITPDGQGGFNLPKGGRLTPDGAGGFNIVEAGVGNGCPAALAGVMAIPMLILIAIVSVFVAPNFIILPIIAILTQGMLGRPLTPGEIDIIVPQGCVATMIFWVILFFIVIRNRITSKK